MDSSGRAGAPILLQDAPVQAMTGGEAAPSPRMDSPLLEVAAERNGLPPLTTFTRRIGRTPLVEVQLRMAEQWRPMLLKLEGHNPGGSIKDRTAYSLVQSLERQRPLEPAASIVESTSGNLGTALAAICRARGYRFTAVVDPKISSYTLDVLHRLHARVEQVVETDPTGGYLLTRLARVRELLEEDPASRWTNQYGNPANPRAHFEMTGPELLRPLARPPAAVFVAVSTGGTLAGVGRYLKAVSPTTVVVGVDVAGSLVFDDRPGPRAITGIGSSRKSDFLTPEVYDDHVLVQEDEAIAACHALSGLVGLHLGASSGAVVAAAARFVRRYAVRGTAICLCPDDGRKYHDTIYESAWLAARGIRLDSGLRALAFDDVIGA